MKIVLDTNVLVSGVYWHGIPEKILFKWINNKFELLYTMPIFNEYFKSLTKFINDNNQQLIEKWLDTINNNGILIKETCDIKTCKDPDDDKFIECAISGKTNYLVTGDHHLLQIKEQFDFQIIKPNEFNKMI